MINKTKHNDQEEEQQPEVSDEEEYQTDEQYEHDRLTDDNAYSEYFELISYKFITIHTWHPNIRNNNIVIFGM
jgi:hypothetical protein